ncbi:MAG: hypothetical protein JO040_06710 [Gemmatimonadetes bacterium]|nr:hypothetical protein [Gemmatimonadota bacterium]
MRLPPRPLALGALLLGCGGAAGAQEHAMHGHPAGTGGVAWSVGAQAIPLVTRADPAFLGQAKTEAYLTQPAVMAHLSAWGGRATLQGTLNLEGATLRRGELNAGIWGEGYVDRRHPHTYLHELVAGVSPLGSAESRAELSLVAGKGFAPFGTDDPMVRPLVKYPLNHHLSQVLERVVAIVAARGGPLTLEAALFNGDEPESPTDLPNWERFGDSHAFRATLAPLAGAEASASFAAVRSPEQAGGGGADQHKWNAALRWERGDGAGRRTYALAEWARTDDRVRGHTTFRYPSLLGEAALRRRGVEAALRWERTVRPEEERLLDPFRAPRPHTDLSILGRTRWTVLTAGLSAQARPFAALGVRPFVEVARLHAATVERTAAFDPEGFYGSDRMWSLSAGARVEAGTLHARMGRYGAAAGGHARHAH